MKGSLKVTGVLVISMLAVSTTFKSETGKYFEIAKNIEIFTNLYREINTYYVDDLDPGKLMRTGIDAMMNSLDPYTNYISESQIESYRYITEGRYNGIGAMSKRMGDFVTITELYEGQPADKAGLKVGDRILAVDGKNATGKNPDEVNDILRGFPGTEVILTIQRAGVADPFDLMLQRGEVKVENVPYKGWVKDDIGYIALTTFTRNAGQNVETALKELQEDNPNLKGIIFDLRGNGGGLLTEAVNVSNVFIPKGEMVVTTKGKVKDWDRSFKTMKSPVTTDLPLTVIVDKNSASASEIVCGVMQDYDRGVLLGQRTYGKGLVQNTRDVGYNSKVKLTTAKYYIPSGRCIQSVEYENGAPVNIPDAERTPFQTRNKRTVLDGGGVRPDIVLDHPSDAAIVKSLVNKNIIFDFVTNYCLQAPEVNSVEEYEFNSFDQFLSFLEEKKFSYDTESEQLLKKLNNSNEKEVYALSAEIEAMQQKIEAAKAGEIEKYKEAIIDLIEKEIANRYFYQRGKIKMGLKNDAEIKEAIAILEDANRYSELLGQ